MARNIMLAKTHHLSAPWTIARANDKQAARINVLKDLLSKLHYKDKNEKLVLADSSIVFNYEEIYLQNGMIAP